MKQSDLFKMASESQAQADAPEPSKIALPKPAWRPEPRVFAVRSESRQDERQIVSVSDLTAQIKSKLEPQFLRVFVRGEVTSFRGPNTSGHLYFGLKDATALIDVRIWQSMARTLKFALKDGLSVIIEGALSVYEPQGRYALIAQRIEPTGVGARALAFAQLKEKLLAAGVIGSQRVPRPLPLVPKRIGVVTSVGGAALKDFLQIAQRRNPRVQVIVADAKVQGEGAGRDVARAIAAVARTQIDVLVVTRGGGSVDDLWTFNEEIVARAIANCRVPVVSAVGHEIDVTLADLAADVRAPTPSAAAELVVPVLADLEMDLFQQRARLRRALRSVLTEAQKQLEGVKAQLSDPRRPLITQRLWLSQLRTQLDQHLASLLKREASFLSQMQQRIGLKDPRLQLVGARRSFNAAQSGLFMVRHGLVEGHRQGLVALQNRLKPDDITARIHHARGALRSVSERSKTALLRRLAADRHQLTQLVAQLEALSPLAVLARGFALVRKYPSDSIVRRRQDLHVGDTLRLKFADDGEVKAKVIELD
jgi:exodeoxyribonuclease VII large subunit